MSFGTPRDTTRAAKLCRSDRDTAADSDEGLYADADGFALLRLADLAAALLDRANLTGIVLGCIEAKFCK